MKITKQDKELLKKYNIDYKFIAKNLSLGYDSFMHSSAKDRYIEYTLALLKHIESVKDKK